MGKTESHCPLEGFCLDPWCQQKQQPQRQMPVPYKARPDGVPSDPGSLRISGVYLPTLGQWWGWWQWTGKSNVVYMALQAPTQSEKL